MADSTAGKSYSTDPALYIYTSLTAGSSHIVTATSRLETILKANKIPFKAIDIATDEKARMLWGRRAGKDETGRQRKLPGLVQMGLIVGDLVEIEEWNEYGELKQHVTHYEDEFTITTPLRTPQPTPKATPAATPQKPKVAESTPKTKENIKPAATETKEEEPKPAEAIPISLTIRQLGAEAAQKANEAKNKAVQAILSTTTTDGQKVKAEDVKEEKKETTKEEESKESLVASPVSSTLELSPTNNRSLNELASLQSPTSTAWKTVDTTPSTSIYHGGIVTEASQEEIAEVESKQAIPEEDEEEEEDDDDDDDDEIKSGASKNDIKA